LADFERGSRGIPLCAFNANAEAIPVTIKMAAAKIASALLLFTAVSHGIFLDVKKANADRVTAK
jgi:hypothetical protein